MTDYQPWTGARLDSLAGKVDLLAEQTGDYARLYQRVADAAAALDTAVTTITRRIDDDAQHFGLRIAALENPPNATPPQPAEVTCGDITRSFHAESAHRHAILLREVAARGVAPPGTDERDARLYRAGLRRAADLIDEWAAQ